MGIELSAVKLQVSDLQRASDFYVQHLDMVAGAQYNKWEWELRPSADAATGVILYCDPDNDNGYTFGTSWMLVRVDDAIAAAERVRSAGVPVQEPITLADGGVTLVFAEDPDGNIIEFVSGTR